MRPLLGWTVLVPLVLMACSTYSSASFEALREQNEKEVAALFRRVRVYDDPQLTEYLASVGGRLGLAGRVNVTVIQDPTLGAFAMPGGRVFVHSGLLSAIENEAQLALIIARESAHDASRLAVREGRAPMSTVASSPTGAALLGLDLRLAIAAAVDGYGPRGERAADVEARRRLTTAGYDPDEGAKLFGLLSAEQVDRAGLAEMFFYANRARMSERLAVWREPIGERGPARADVGEFARRMRPLVRDNAALDLRAGRFALARRQLDRVLAEAGDDAIAQLNYGELYRLRSQRAEGAERAEAVQRAVERYQRAVELDPHYAEPFRQLALLHFQEGDRARARAALERYLALAADGPDARRVRAFLAILGQ